MQRHPIPKTAHLPRGNLFWLAVSGLAIAQLVAFWMLCNQQVRQAEARHATVRVAQMAVADCLREIPRATLDSCSGRFSPAAAVPNNLLVAAHKQTAGAGPAPMSSPVQVSFTLR
jgi:hypothetical protein